MTKLDSVNYALKAAREANYQLLLETLSESLELFSKDQSYLSSYYKRQWGYVELTRRSKILVIGDIHGDLNTLSKILEGEGKRVLEEDGYIVFLGDYVDRGPNQAEVLAAVLRLKLAERDRVILLRGNHEPPPHLIPSPHDFPYVLKSLYGEEGRRLYETSMEIFQRLPHIASTPNGIVFIHGGPPSKPYRLKELARPSSSILEELLWNDPSPVNGVAPSPRGAGVLFGPDVTKRFLEINNMKLIVRGHEPCEGYKLDHGGLVVTIFSRVGSPYYNRHAGYLKMSLDQDPSHIEEFLYKI